MDKKVTTIVGIALGATLAAGFGLYKYFSKKSAAGTVKGSTGNFVRNAFTGGYIGNSLVKSTNLYGSHVDNGLVGGGLFVPPTANRANGYSLVEHSI